jgi:hypothetical protein
VPRQVGCKSHDNGFILCDLQADGSWADQLSASFEPVALADFDARTNYLQTAPGLSWSSKPFATRATRADVSRITIRPGVLRRRIGTGEFLDLVVDDREWSALLYDNFCLADSVVR